MVPMKKTILLLSVIFVFLYGCTLDKQSAEKQWKLAYEEQFDNNASLNTWHLDGFANLKIKHEDGVSFLEIETYPSKENPENKQSVLWLDKEFRGDIRYKFRARATDKNRSIFFFNANPTSDAKFDVIYSRNLPDAQYERYAAEDGLETYTIGILRSDEKTCNLRYIGGNTAGAYREYMQNPGSEAQAVFGAETIFKSYDSPFEGQPDTWFDFDIVAEGDSIFLSIDGNEIFRCKDPGNVGRDSYAWTPLSDGGWLAFRNFVPATVCIDYVKVYRK